MVNHTLTSTIQRQRGLFQGSIIAPFLFNLYIDDLAEAIDELGAVQNPLDAPTTTAGNNASEPECTQRFHFPPGLLFADDVVLFAKLIRHMQALLALVQSWSDDNGMTIGIDKCGTFSDEQLQINDKAIPVVQTYKYLGFPTTQRGIAWQQHVDDGATKASKLLRFLQQWSDTWPEYVRLAIGRAFVRPIFEYGAQLIYHLHSTRHVSLDKMRHMTDEMTTWVTGIHGRNAAARALCDVPLADDRCFALAVTFIRHVDNAAADNPIRNLLRHMQARIPWQADMVIPRAVSKTLLRRLPTVTSHEHEAESVYQARQLREYHRAQYRSHSRDAAYILPGARRPEPTRSPTQLTLLSGYTLRPHHLELRRSPGCDRGLFVDEAQLRRCIIAWRCNMFLHKRRCVCKQDFNRSHVRRCNLLGDSRTQQIAETLIQQHTNDFGPQVTGLQYTEIDALLNHQEYAHVRWAFSKVVARLCPGSRELSDVEDSPRNDVHANHNIVPDDEETDELLAERRLPTNVRLALQMMTTDTDLLPSPSFSTSDSHSSTHTSHAQTPSSPHPHHTCDILFDFSQTELGLPDDVASPTPSSNHTICVRLTECDVAFLSPPSTPQL